MTIPDVQVGHKEESAQRILITCSKIARNLVTSVKVSKRRSTAVIFFNYTKSFLASCVDGNKSCPSWAQKGECSKNPGYMLVNCKKSCNQCSSGTSHMNIIQTTNTNPLEDNETDHWNILVLNQAQLQLRDLPQQQGRIQIALTTTTAVPVGQAAGSAPKTQITCL